MMLFTLVRLYDVRWNNTGDDMKHAPDKRFWRENDVIIAKIRL